MLRWSVIFLIIALVALILGFGGVAGAAINIAKVLFFVFIALFVVTLILGVTVFKKVKNVVNDAFHK